MEYAYAIININMMFPCSINNLIQNYTLLKNHVQFLIDLTCCLQPWKVVVHLQLVLLKHLEKMQLVVELILGGSMVLKLV